MALKFSNSINRAVVKKQNSIVNKVNKSTRAVKLTKNNLSFLRSLKVL